MANSKQHRTGQHRIRQHCAGDSRIRPSGPQPRPHPHDGAAVLSNGGTRPPTCRLTWRRSIRACCSGLPRGQVSELVGAPSSGRLTLLLRFLAAATRRGEIVAFVDTCDRLDVASATAAGIDLDRLLWIRGHALTAPKGDLLERTLDRALKGLNLVLQAGGSASWRSTWPTCRPWR